MKQFLALSFSASYFNMYQIAKRKHFHSTAFGISVDSIGTEAWRLSCVSMEKHNFIRRWYHAHLNWIIAVYFWLLFVSLLLLSCYCHCIETNRTKQTDNNIILMMPSNFCLIALARFILYYFFLLFVHRESECAVKMDQSIIHDHINSHLLVISNSQLTSSIQATTNESVLHKINV